MRSCSSPSSAASCAPSCSQALARAAPRLRGEVARRMRLKYAPELSFQADPSFREAARIETLLAEERSTLARQREDDDGSG